MALKGRALFVTSATLAIVLGVSLAQLTSVGSPSRATGQARAVVPMARRAVDAGRSFFVYPAEEVRLRMDHTAPAHAALPCTRCHARASESAVASESLWPSESACASCHQETDRATATVERCGFCHRETLPSAIPDAGPEVVVTPRISTSVHPAPRLRFSHRAHAATDCVACHDMRGVGIATREQLPTMESCERCHSIRGLAETHPTSGVQPFACADCHLSRPDGVLETRSADGALSPPRTMAGLEHDHEWLTRHRWVAADQGPLCATCHRESDCADCHDGRVRPRRVHIGDYLTRHVVEARRDEPRCASCHNAATFCAECHSRLGLATFSAPATRAAGRYHPPSAMWVRGPNQHAVEAQRSMQSCIGCHAESDCVVCHGDARVGGAGLSPHPPGFTARCGSMLDENASACVTCHGSDLTRLRAACGR